MHSARQCFIVAVGGHSGAGKTTLVRALVQELGDAVSLSFDDYYPNRVPSTRHPADLREWLASGARAEDWSTPQMAADLQALARGESIELPGGKGMLNSAAFIILDEPFGRTRPVFQEL